MNRNVAFSTLLGLLGAAAALDAQAGDWVFKVGVHDVNPKSGNGHLAGGTLAADIGSDARPTVTAEYFWAPSWGVEVLAALPFEHDVRLNGTKAGTVKHLPPVVGVQYHFNADGTVSPFVGLGVNYTYTFSEHATGPLAGTRLRIGDSVGAALHAGVDFKLKDGWLFTVDARWIDIDADVSVNGTRVGSVQIDPLVYGIAVGRRF